MACSFRVLFLGQEFGDVAALLFVAPAIYADVGVSLLIGRHSIW